MTESSEQRELSLVGKVELRIALIETDSKLQVTLKTYLPPLLLKLASEHLSVRNKVSCNSINVDKSACVRLASGITFRSVARHMLCARKPLMGMVFPRSFPFVNISMLELNHRMPPQHLLWHP